MCLEDEVFERSMIEFPEHLKLNAVEELFVYLTEQMGCEIDYTFEVRKRVGSVVKDEDIPDEEVRETAVKYGAVRTKPYTAGVLFVCVSPNIADALNFSGIQFSTNSGRRLEQYRKDEVAVWDAVREHVKNYFLLKNTIKK